MAVVHLTAETRNNFVIVIKIAITMVTAVMI